MNEGLENLILIATFLWIGIIIGYKYKKFKHQNEASKVSDNEQKEKICSLDRNTKFCSVSPNCNTCDYYK